MCSSLACGITTTVLGAVLVFASSFVGYWVIPGIVENQIINEVVLRNDTDAMDRFVDVPLILNFSVRLFEIVNPDSVLGGGVPIVREAGPYIYKLRQERVIEYFEEDLITYRRRDLFEFDAVASYPLTEDDEINIINLPYLAVMNAVEAMDPRLLSAVSLGLNGIFGQYNSPIAKVNVGDFLFNGITICANTLVVSAIACGIIRSMSQDIRNMEVQPDNSIKFSVLGYRNLTLGSSYEVMRGEENIEDVGRITLFDDLPYFRYWHNNPDGETSICNTIKGTDSGLFNPFVDTSRSLYAINPDICRTVELRYDGDTEFQGISAVRFSANEWMFPEEDCYCLNVTQGVTRNDGCLLRGTNELFTCVGSYLVISYPHFLYGDPIYQNSIIGLHPNRDTHRIAVEIEPNTGNVMRGAKRAQFNIFMRPLQGIAATRLLRTALMPIFWAEESVELSDELVDMLKSRLISTLNLLAILIPVLVAVTGVILVVGIIILIRSRLRKKSVDNTPTSRSVDVL